MGMFWKGDEVVAKVEAATKLAIDQTTAAAVNRAKSEHPWKNRTGTLEGSLQMRSARAEGLQIRGEWGSFDVNYAIFLELGTANMPAMPYLRPAADAEYPRLAERITGAMK